MSQQPAGLPPFAEMYNRWIQLIQVRQFTVNDLFNGAATLQSLGQKQLAADLYKAWIAINADSEVLYAVYYNYGVVLNDLRDRFGAMNAYRESIRIKRDFHPPYINLGRVLEEIGQAGQAVAQWMEVAKNSAAVNGDAVSYKVTALHQAARVLESLNSDQAAEDSLRQSLDINPRQVEAVQHWISLRQRQCKWPAIAPWERVTRKDLLTGISTLSLFNLADDPMFHLAKAHHYARNVVGKHKPTRLPQGIASRRDHAKLRIGYVSSDLREHAVGFGMTELIEQHDREHFEIYTYYCGIGRTDPTQQRVMKSVDRWVDLNPLSDDQAAARIAEDEIDILVDLNGYTKDARTKVFARRPAPIIVNWFGYPGSMGTPYHHYIIADATIIPPEDEIYYTEKVLRLPCYQPNDRKRVVSSNRPSRAQVGLPDDAFVYCSLNGMQKITARVFGRWMTILKQVPNSVLWLLSGTTKEANERLRQLAAAQGVAAERLIFADKLPNPDHLARYPLADLFLDSLPYGAHTTAADSLWMGVPILTFAGRSFPARVCTSLVRAAGVGELECSSADDYVTRAIDFGRNREKLAAIRAKLVSSRDTCLLFNTTKLARHIEDLYREMWSDLKRGELPVPDLRNLDIYHEIGLELDVEAMDALSDEAYIALYREKLATLHEAYPVQSDGRLWQGARPAVPTLVTHRAVA